MRSKFALSVVAVIGFLAVVAIMKAAATLLAGILSAAAVIFLLLKLDLKKVLAFDIGVDVIVTFAFVFLFAGTYSGMVAAAMAGCLVSGFLLAAKKTLGYERPRFGRNGVRWENVDP